VTTSRPGGGHRRLVERREQPMGAAIGDILGLAAGVAVSPLPIVA
jgi:hypothetical protein